MDVKPYSQEIYGDLIDYLRKYKGFGTDNMFRGAEYFFEMKDRGFIIPEISFIRVNRVFGPDIGYIVSKDYMLESPGQKESNMSLIGAEEKVYDPKEALEDQLWSITGLKLPKIFDNKNT